MSNPIRFPCSIWNNKCLNLSLFIKLFASSFSGTKLRLPPHSNCVNAARPKKPYVPFRRRFTPALILRYLDVSSARQKGNSLAPLSHPVPWKPRRSLITAAFERRGKKAYSATLPRTANSSPTSICCAPLNLIQVLKTPVTAARALQAAKSQPRGKKIRDERGKWAELRHTR